MSKKVLTVTDLECLVNALRTRSPGDGVSLTPELACLGELYGRMIFHGWTSIAPEQLSPGEAMLLGKILAGQAS